MQRCGSSLGLSAALAKERQDSGDRNGNWNGEGSLRSPTGMEWMNRHLEVTQRCIHEKGWSRQLVGPAFLESNLLAGQFFTHRIRAKTVVAPEPEPDAHDSNPV